MLRLRLRFTDIFFWLLIGVYESQTNEQIEVKPHKYFKDLKCSYPRISSVTKLRDHKYFISTNGQKFWLVSESEDKTLNNGRDLKTINTEWTKIDASVYFGFDSECEHQFRDKLVLVNFNEKTKRNEVMVGSIKEWEWTPINWSDVKAFEMSEQIDWQKGIDGISIIEDNLFIFQNETQIRVDCNYDSVKKEWFYEMSDNFRQVQLNGPIEAIYFEDKYKDTYPLYAIRGQSYFICFIKENNEEWPTCEEYPLIDSLINPKPNCSVDRDPNEKLWLSMNTQIKSLYTLLVVVIIVSLIYLYILCRATGEPKQNKVKNEVSPKSKTNKPLSMQNKGED